MARKRHKWSIEKDIEQHFIGCYKVNKCTVCALLKLHNYSGGQYFHTYIVNGELIDKLPECNNLINI